MVRPDSVELYQTLASTRRLLASEPDIPAEILRDMLLRTLEACEMLSQSVDELQNVLERLIGA